jgi:HK97 family phage prohead protease
MSNKNQEVRIFDLERIELRQEGDADIIEGFTAVYNSRSQDLGGFVEVIEPGFFSDVLDDDVRALFNHDPNIVLGRTKSGTLRLFDTTDGLRVVNELPKTTWGNDLKVSIERGDVDQMSFGFTVKKGGDSWAKRNGVNIRTLKPGGCKRLYDVSPVTYPAYAATSVQARDYVRAIEDGSQEIESFVDEAIVKEQERIERRKREIQISELENWR